MCNFIDELLQFSLTEAHLNLLFALEVYLVREDIESSTLESIDNKKKWLDNWIKNINSYCEAFYKESFNSDIYLNIETVYSLNDIRGLLKIIRDESSNKLPLYLILLECVLFQPYFSFGNESKGRFEKLKLMKQNLFSKEVPKFKNTQFMSVYENIAKELEISPLLPQKILDSYNSSIGKLTDRLKKMICWGGIGSIFLALTAGMGAISIAPLFADAGLFGAAAITNGLAALGGGALSVGGFGMAGGMAVLVSGGALIGGISGVSIQSAFIQNPDLTLMQVAKFEVVCKEIILGALNDESFFRKIFMQQYDVIKNLKDLYIKKLIDKSVTDDELKKLKLSLSYLENSLERNAKELRKYP